MADLPERSADTMLEAISMSSPSGRVSKRSKEASLKRLSTSLFGEGGLQKAPVQQPSEKESDMRRAAYLRDMASRGMSTKRFNKEAEAIESKYKTVGNTPMPTQGSSQPHGYGHTASQRDGALRLSGNPKAHRIGKR